MRTPCHPGRHPQTAPSNLEPPLPMSPGQSMNPEAETFTSAADTVGGATSNSEQRHDGKHDGKREGQGAAHHGEGSFGGAVDPKNDERHRALDEEEAETGRGDEGSLGASELAPATAEEVAAERS